MMLLAALLSLSADVQRVTIRVKIEGQTFRVTRRGDQVIVANKAIFVARTPDMFRRMKVAVRQVTGCEIADELWSENTLVGNLNCTPPVAP